MAATIVGDVLLFLLEARACRLDTLSPPCGRRCASLFLDGRDKPAMAHPGRYVSSSPSLHLLLHFIPSYFLPLIFFLARVQRRR
jgi:hypothetical protein